MRYDPFKRRLGKLETGAKPADAVLRFADASTRAVSVRYPLELFLAACRRLASALEAQHEPAASALSVVRPLSPYDELIDLLGRAEDIQTETTFLHWIFGVCHQCIEEEPKTLR
jgi:hypothetical protein